MAKSRRRQSSGERSTGAATATGRDHRRRIATPTVLLAGILAAGAGAGSAALIGRFVLSPAVSPAQPKPDRTDALALTPAHVEAQFREHFSRGYRRFQAEQFSLAVDDFLQATQVAPHLPEGHYYLGESYAKLFLKDKAEQAYRQSLSLQPDFRPSQERLTLMLHDGGRYDESIAMLEAMRAVTPDDPYVLGELAVNHAARDHHDQAKALLERYVQIRPTDPWGYTHLASAHEGLGDDARAESLYRKALDLNRHYGLAHYWLGQMLSRLGRGAESQQALAEYDRIRKLENREHELGQTLLRDPRSVPALAALAVVRHSLGKVADAVATVDRALQLAPGDTRLLALRHQLQAVAPGQLTPPSP